MGWGPRGEEAEAKAKAPDPNFPKGGLDITPSFGKYNNKRRTSTTRDESEAYWRQDREEDIIEWGIAGRIWEATYVLTGYLSCQPEGIVFDPPCSLFQNVTSSQLPYYNVVELGAGAGIVGLHLALEMEKSCRHKGVHPSNQRSQVVLTDLDNVLPLLHRNISRANLLDTPDRKILVQAQALPWGSLSHANKILRQDEKPITHIMCSDLVYFPELLAPLLRTLIHLTTTSERSSPEVIIGYKLRSYSKEEPFWRALGIWFDFAPVLCKNQGSKDRKEEEEDWRRLGSQLRDCGQQTKDTCDNTPAEDEMFVFIAQRKKKTADCIPPTTDEQLLAGWMQRGDDLFRGREGADTFELLLMNAMQGS